MPPDTPAHDPFTSAPWRSYFATPDIAAEQWARLMASAADGSDEQMLAAAGQALLAAGRRETGGDDDAVRHAARLIVDALERDRQRAPRRLSPQQTVFALCGLLALNLSRPQALNVAAAHAERLYTLLRQPLTAPARALAALLTLQHATYTGDDTLMRALLLQLEHQTPAPGSLPPLLHLRLREAQADAYFIVGQQSRNQEMLRLAADEALALGLHGVAKEMLFSLTQAALARADLDAARRLIGEYSPLLDPLNRSEQAYAGVNLSWLATQEARHGDGERLARAAVREAQLGDLPAFERAAVQRLHGMTLVNIGRHPEAAAVFLRAGDDNSGPNGDDSRAAASLCHAANALDAHDLPAARRHLQAAADGVAPERFPLLWRWCGEAFARLVAVMLEEGIAVHQAQLAVRERALPMPEDAGELWPAALRLRCLGPFAIERVDALPAPRKAAVKPLELIKLLAVSAPNSVPARKLADALWPESEGDLAQQSLNMTLLRARKLLGDETAISRSESGLGLDTRRVWSDLNVCRHAVTQVLAILPSQWIDSAPLQLRKTLQTLSLHRGELLEGDDLPWLPPQRQRLSRDLQRTLTQAIAAQLAARDARALRKLLDAAEQGGFDITALVSAAVDQLTLASLPVDASMKQTLQKTMAGITG